MTPWLSVVLPTIGRPGLERALRSVRRQWADPESVEIVVVEDTLDSVQPHVEALARQYQAVYAGHAGDAHCWGHPQRNAGQGLARGRWLSFMADDDIYAAGALDAMAAATVYHGEGRPILFRVKMNQYHGRLIWQHRTQLYPGNIDAECILTPNEPDKLGVWTMRYEGDFDFIRSTVDAFRGVVWHSGVIAIARPTEEEDWTCA